MDISNNTFFIENKEAHVSFETAKLLQKGGFDWFTYYSYEEYDGKIWIRLTNGEDTGRPTYAAPTQQMACRWLREVHKIDISVTPDDDSWWIKVTELESWSAVFNGKVLNSDDIKYAYEGDTSTKEDCYEAALQYILTNLI